MWMIVAFLAFGAALFYWELRKAGVCGRCEGWGTVWDQRVDGPVVCPSCGDEWGMS